mgnify:CR=1 FL=1
MFILIKRGRLSFDKLAPIIRKWQPRKCALSGETENHQTPFPAPWQTMKFPNREPKTYPLEIDHINSLETDNRAENLQWLSKLHHILKTAETITRPRPRRGATTVRTFPVRKVINDEIKQRLFSPSLF